MPISAGPARTADPGVLRPNHVRSIALAGAVVGVVLLPIAAAQATPSQGSASSAAAAGAAGDSPSASSSAARAVAAEFCGPVRVSAVSGGTVRVQACVEQAAGAASARIYVANGSSNAQSAVLNLTGADGTVVQVQCTVAAGDGAGRCEAGPQAVAAGDSLDAIAELTQAGAPVSAGVVHIESGLVAAAGGR